MSRLNDNFLTSLGINTWNAAYGIAAKSLGQPSTTYKNLRDEFDPIHSNPRVGWHSRPLRDSRMKVAQELGDVSDAALVELVRHILRGDEDSIVEAIDALIPAKGVAAGVANRLLTGRLAEEYFMTHCDQLVNFERHELLDLRLAASGYDFGNSRMPDIAIEVKGLRAKAGDILFTDREWTEAGIRKGSYWLALIRNIGHVPEAEIIVNPFETIPARCIYQRSLTASWRASV